MNRRPRLALAILVLAAVAACATAEQTRYYRLTAEGGPGPRAAASVRNQPLVTIGPVQIPSHLDRPQIVNTEASNLSTMSEFDRWVEPLPRGLTRVLVENLTRSRPDYLIASYDGSGPGAVEYQVVVDVSTLELQRGRAVSMSAFWRIVQQRTLETTAQGRTTVEEPVSGAGIDALAAGLSRAAGRLSADIAAGLPAR